MLAVSEEAASAIAGILASHELPDAAGVRITTERGGPDGSAPQSSLRLQVVEAPESGDAVVEDAPVFLAPETAQLLEDKLLDAELHGSHVHFALREQQGAG